MEDKATYTPHNGGKKDPETGQKVRVWGLKRWHLAQFFDMDCDKKFYYWLRTYMFPRELREKMGIADEKSWRTLRIFSPEQTEIFLQYHGFSREERLKLKRIVSENGL